MAESFAVPGKECSVTDIERAGGDTWKAYCDCAFLEPVIETTYYVDGKQLTFNKTIVTTLPSLPVSRGGEFVPLENPDAPPSAMQKRAPSKTWNKPATLRPTQTRVIPMTEDEKEIAIKALRAKNPNAQWRIETRVIGTRQPENWLKCMHKFCADPGGCSNPQTGGARADPLNVQPGMLAAPWTELGASARGIPKRGAGFFYDLNSLFSIDAAAYAPEKLWKTFWENPFLYALLMAKASLLIPGGAILALAGNVTAIPVALLPMIAIKAEAEAWSEEKKTEWMLNPVIKGSIKSVGFVIKYLGTCGFGWPGACSAGLIVQKAAQDQIDTGEINKIQTPELRAIVVFLAQSGDVLVQAVLKAVSGKLEKSFFAIIEDGTTAAADVIRRSQMAAKEKEQLVLVLTIIAKASGVAGVIADDLRDKKSFDILADDAANKLLGFRPSDYFVVAKENTKAAVALVTNAEKRNGTSIDKMSDFIKAIGNALKGIADGVKHLSDSIGGGLEEVTKAFNNVAGAMGAAQDAAQQAVDAVAHASVPVAAGAGVGAGGPIVKPDIIVKKTDIVTAPPPKVTYVAPFPTEPVAPPKLPSAPSAPLLAPPLSPPPRGGGAMTAVAGAAAGALFGGPVGAVIGGAAGFLAGRSPTQAQAQMAYFGAVARDASLPTQRPAASKPRPAPAPAPADIPFPGGGFKPYTPPPIASPIGKAGPPPSPIGKVIIMPGSTSKPTVPIIVKEAPSQTQPQPLPQTQPQQLPQTQPQQLPQTAPPLIQETQVDARQSTPVTSSSSGGVPVTGGIGWGLPKLVPPAPAQTQLQPEVVPPAPAPVAVILPGSTSTSTQGAMVQGTVPAARLAYPGGGEELAIAQEQVPEVASASSAATAADVVSQALTTGRVKESDGKGLLVLGALVVGGLLFAGGGGSKRLDGYHRKSRSHKRKVK